MSAMLMLAAAAAKKLTVWERIQSIPKETWINVGIALLICIVLIKMWKNLREVGEIVPWIVMVLLGGSVVLYWTYERNEPKFLSPIINELSRVLPSKIEYKDAPDTK
jgi:hypothetical protein